MASRPPKKGHLSRAFLALRTHPEQTRLFQPVRDAMPGTWNVSNRHDDHISLAFAGGLAPGDTERLCTLVRAFAAAVQPFSMSFPMFGTFYNANPAQNKKEESYIVLYAAPDAAAAHRIQRLHHDLSYKIMRPNGFNFGLRNITPHNTLAHVRNKEEEQARLTAFLEEHHTLDIPPSPYGSICLLDSYDRNDPRHPSRHGNAYTKYTVIEEFPLGGGAAPVPAPLPSLLPPNV